MMNKVVEMGKKLAEKAVTAKRWLMCARMCAIVEMNSAVCYASQSEGDKAAKKITDKFVNLEDLVLGIIGAAGVIYLAKSVFEFASAYQSSDSSGTNAAVKGILGALMMIFIDIIIAFLKK
ncbi:MAG: hypothetical protein HFJ09_06740 [Lachnospiraceae bacterium]|nr:hypothetical protein [Lachnospiraceae bacterium]